MTITQPGGIIDYGPHRHRPIPRQRPRVCLEIPVGESAARDTAGAGRARHSVRAVFANQDALVATGGAQGIARPTHAVVVNQSASIGRPRRARRDTPYLSAIEQRRWAVSGAIEPNPILHPFAQAFANGIHQNIFILFLQLVMVTQAMVKKIALPFHPKLDRHKLLPVGDQCFHARRTREGDDGVQMVGHEQTNSAMPEKVFMVVRHRCEHAVANSGLAKLVFARRHAFDGDEKTAAFRHPLRDGVWQFFTDGQIHGKTIMNRAGEKKPAGGARHSVRAVVVNQNTSVGRRRRARDCAPYLHAGIIETQF